MSGATTKYGLPYPTGTDPVVVHTDLQALAVKTDDAVTAIGDAAEQAVNVTATFVERSLSVVDAPSAGPWLVGTNWRGTEQSGGDVTLPDPVDVAAGNTSRPLMVVDGAAPIVDPVTGRSLRRLTSDATRVVCWGDSLTQGYPRPPFEVDGSNAWPGVLDAAWTGGSVTNGGVQGQTAEQIALRQGGLALTVDAFTLPADTSAVPFPVQQVIPAAFGFAFPGQIAGIPVTATAAAAGTWTVKRDTAGASVAVPAGSMFDTLAEQHADAVTVIFAGRNDALSLTEGNLSHRITRSVAAVSAMVGRLTPAHPAYLVMGTLTSTSEISGTLGWRFVTGLNEQLAALFAGHYLDIRRYLIDDGLSDAGITPTTGDSNAMAGDTIPPSLSIDGIHYTVQTAGLVATKVKATLDAKGYLA